MEIKIDTKEVDTVLLIETIKILTKELKKRIEKFEEKNGYKNKTQ